MQDSFHLSFEVFLDQTKINFIKQETDGFLVYLIHDKHYGLVPYTCYDIEQRPICDYYIFEDIWYYKSNLVRSRLLSIFGLNQKIPARKTMVQKMDKTQAEEFLDLNHLMGKAKAAYHYGLFLDNTCFAIMSWSKSRVFTDKQVYYRSYELIRFSNLTGFTIIGGFSKLLKHFILKHHPAHIMTYTDNDWGTANSFERLGFRRFGSSQKLRFFVNPVTHERVYQLPMNHDKNYTLHCQNGGSTKWIIDLQK